MTSSRDRSGFRPGMAVTICGLKGAAHLNGHAGRLLQFHGPTGRWQVELEEGVKALKEDNIIAAEGARGPEPSGQSNSGGKRGEDFAPGDLIGRLLQGGVGDDASGEAEPSPDVEHSRETEWSPRDWELDPEPPAEARELEEPEELDLEPPAEAREPEEPELLEEPVQPESPEDLEDPEEEHEPDGEPPDSEGFTDDEATPRDLVEDSIESPPPEDGEAGEAGRASDPEDLGAGAGGPCENVKIQRDVPLDGSVPPNAQAGFDGYPGAYPEHHDGRAWGRAPGHRSWGGYPGHLPPHSHYPAGPPPGYPPGFPPPLAAYYGAPPAGYAAPPPAPRSVTFASREAAVTRAEERLQHSRSDMTFGDDRLATISRLVQEHRLSDEMELGLRLLTRDQVLRIAGSPAILGLREPMAVQEALLAQLAAWDPEAEAIVRALRKRRRRSHRHGSDGRDAGHHGTRRRSRSRRGGHAAAVARAASERRHRSRRRRRRREAEDGIGAEKPRRRRRETEAQTVAPAAQRPRRRRRERHVQREDARLAPVAADRSGGAREAAPAAGDQQAAGDPELEAWLAGLDGGRGALIRYLPPLRAEFGGLSSLAATVLPTPVSSSVVGRIDPSLWHALGVEALGHRLLLAKGIVALSGPAACE